MVGSPGLVAQTAGGPHFVSLLLGITSRQQQTHRALCDRLRVEYEIAKPSNKLLAVAELDSDTSIDEVKRIRGKKLLLTTAGVRALRAEYSDTKGQQYWHGMCFDFQLIRQFRNLEEMTTHQSAVETSDPTPPKSWHESSVWPVGAATKRPLWQTVVVVGALILTGCGSPKRELQPEDIWKSVSPSVVRVEATSLEGEILVGSGFVCELEGRRFILSNRHVVQGAKRVRVGTSAQALIQAPGYRISPDLDLALIDLPDGLHVPPLKTRQGEVEIGERVFALGFPLGLNKSITQGLVSSETDKLVQFDAPISSGNSGGPLVDKNGEALGVVTAGSTGSADQVAQNLNFAIKTAFVPKAELFKEPIVRFYDAWRELVKFESGLIDDLQDQRVFDVEACVLAESSLPFAFALDTNFTKLGPEKRKEAEKVFKSMYAEPLERVIQRHGSLEAGVKAVVSFLRSRVAEFDKVPEMFAGLGSDDLLRRFGRDERKNPIFKWDIEPSQIVPLLKVSMEFAKAKYEDTAFGIEFYSRVLAAFERGETNFLSFMAKAESKWIGERTTVRLPYDKLRPDCLDEETVRMYFLCQQKYGHRSTGPNRFGFEGTSMTQQISEWGGFEGSITSMFGQRALERAEQGDVEGAIHWMMNEVEEVKYPDLGVLAFFYACKGDYEKAYTLHLKAYAATFDQVDAFSLQTDHSSSRTYLLKCIRGESDDTPYPASLRINLSGWKRFAAAKPSLVIAKLPLAEAFDSPGFHDLNEIEKCWVLASQESLAFSGTDYQEQAARFETTVKENPEARTVYEKYFKKLPP